MVFILLRIWGTIRFFRFLCYHPEDPPAIEVLVFLHVSGIIIYTMKDGFMACIGDRWNRDKIVSQAAVFVSSRKCFRLFSSSRLLLGRALRDKYPASKLSFLKERERGGEERKETLEDKPLACEYSRFSSAPCRLGRFARKNVCASATKMPLIKKKKQEKSLKKLT